MTKLAPEWVRTSDPVIRSPVRYRWTTAPASNRAEAHDTSDHEGVVTALIMAYICLVAAIATGIVLYWSVF